MQWSDLAALPPGRAALQSCRTALLRQHVLTQFRWQCQYQWTTGLILEETEELNGEVMGGFGGMGEFSLTA